MQRDFHLISSILKFKDKNIRKCKSGIKIIHVNEFGVHKCKNFELENIERCKCICFIPICTHALLQESFKYLSCRI